MKFFSNKGFHKSTVDEIAAAAWVGKGTVYRRFGDKRALFMTVVDTYLTETLAFVGKAVEAESTPTARLRAFTTAYLEYFTNRSEFFVLIMKELGSFGEEFRESVIRKYLAHVDIIEECVKDGISEGVMKDVDTRAAAFALFAMASGALRRWLFSGEAFALEKDGEVVLEIFMDGMLKRVTRAGRSSQ